MDMAARLLLPELSAVIGQTVVIDNVVGAGGSIGARKLIQSAPDGHVLMYGSISETVLIPQTSPAVGYRTQDLQAVSIIGSTPLVLAARKDFPARNIDALVKLARLSPLKYSYGSSGVGSYGHLMFEAMARKQGIRLLHVPYKGNSQILADMVSGQIDLALASLPSAIPYAKANMVELLGVSAPQRLTDWPKLPTFSESSTLEQEHFSMWGGVFAPRGLAPEIALKINTAFSKVLDDEQIRAKLTYLGITLEKPKSPFESQRFYERQVRHYQGLVNTP